jgi:hypothetical protein
MTTLKMGYTNPLTDAFGSHPTLGAVLDLNDGQTFTLVSPEGLELEAPPRTILPAGNVRTQGERAVRALYRHNRQATARVLLGPGSSYASFVASVRQLLLWLAAPPAVPLTLQYQPFSASAAVYPDVVAVAHDIPSDEDQWLRLQLEPIEIVFWCRPGLRGDRVTLSNLVPNPGFEGPMGGALTPGGILVFNDLFNSGNAYTWSGTSGSVASSTLTIPNGSQAIFGSPAWGAYQQWQVRFTLPASAQNFFYLHYTDANNNLYVLVSQGTPGSFQIVHTVAGTGHILASSTPTLGVNTYWVQITQFPTSPSTPTNGNPPNVQATVLNDSSGNIGTTVATLGPVPTFDSVTALVGKPRIGSSGASSIQVGGAGLGSGGNQVMLFGPGGWAVGGVQTSTFGDAAMAWDGATTIYGMSGNGGANTYPNGPVTSFGAARIDAAPAGFFDGKWFLYGGGTPGGSLALPVANALDVLGYSVYVKSSGLHATNGKVSVQITEYNAAGSATGSSSGDLSVTTGATLNAGWTQLSGTYTTHASCAYVDFALRAFDTANTGESANAIVWFNNAQLWDQTAVGNGGQTVMPWCDLRGPNSPYQMVMSGLLGDLPAPALVSLGTYLNAWAKGSTMLYLIGRRGSVLPNFQMGGPCVGFFGTAFPPQASAVLDGASLGGYYVKVTLSTSGWSPRSVVPKASDSLGTYHVLSRLRSQDPTPTGVQVRAKSEELLDPWYQDAGTLKLLGTYYGPYVNPLSAGNVWTVCDAGQVQLPPFARGGLRDDSQVYEGPRGEWVGTTPGGAEADQNWITLLPIDGSLLTGVINNPNNNAVASATGWLWCYVDGLLVNRAGSGAALGGAGQDGPGWTYSIETAALPAPAHGGGGVGSQSTGPINVNNAGDPYLTLDPAQGVSGNQTTSGGVNQLVGIVADGGAGTVFALQTEVTYSPLYLWPR